MEARNATLPLGRKTKNLDRGCHPWVGYGGRVAVFQNQTETVASRVSMKQLRKIRIFQRDAYLSMDFVNKQAVLFRKSPDFDPSMIDLSAAGSQSPGDLSRMVFSKFLTREVLPMDSGDQLEAEIGDFLDAVQNDRPPAVTGEHGRRALATAEQIVAAIAAQSWDDPEQT